MQRSLLFILLIGFSLPLLAQFAPATIDNKHFDQPASRQKITFSGMRQSALLDNYDVHFYFLDIQLERTSTEVAGNVLIQSTTTTVLDTFALELIDELTVDSVFINGAIRPFQHLNDHIFIPLSSPAPSGTSLSTKVYYHGNPATGGGFFSGISNDFSPSWNNQVTWTLSEPFNANQWWPCKQVLTDKADSSWVFITTDNTNKAGSNGILTATVPLSGSKTRYEWKSRNPINYYLISASVAEYVEYNIYAHPAGTTDSLLIQNYVYNNPATLPNFQAEIDLTDDFVELYSDLFGLYPFMDEKYGHCMAPMGGGMEHQTMTTLGFFDFYLICHELAHMWFGDNVTCSTWSDIWINEGFASYAEYLAAQYLDSYNEAQSHMADVHYSVMEQSNGSIYVPFAQTNDADRIFDGRLSYDKGSAIIHMMRFEMQNDSLFFNTLRNFQAAYGDSNATGDDFKNIAATTSGINFDDFFNQWYYGEGYPTYQITWNQANDSLCFNATQTTSSAVTPLFKMLMEIKITFAGGDTLIRWYQDAQLTSFKIPFSKTPTVITVDPQNWVVDGPASVAVSVAETNHQAFFTLAPNPCENRLLVSFPVQPEASATMIISDITGRTITEMPASQYNQLDVSAYTPGIYMVTVQMSHDRFVQKFIKY